MIERRDQMNWVKLVVSVLVCQLAGFLGGFFTQAAVQSWYPTIRKPVFTPPNWMFGPVWIFLYLLMGIALYLVWNSAGGGHARRVAIILFFIQLGLNVLWSFLFFYLKNPLLGFIEILLLFIFIVLTAWKFFSLNRLAGILFVPYILWVAFASILNYFLWVMNR